MTGLGYMIFKVIVNLIITIISIWFFTIAPHDLFRIIISVFFINALTALILSILPIIRQCMILKNSDKIERFDIISIKIKTTSVKLCKIAAILFFISFLIYYFIN